jgi:uncharacterized protein YegP (UPF0339 family)
MISFAPVIYVDLVKSKVPRKQPWRWVAKSAGNQKKLATSGESYSNRQDALNAAALVFGDNSTVYLREAEQGNQILRMAVPL